MTILNDYKRIHPQSDFNDSWNKFKRLLDEESYFFVPKSYKARAQRSFKKWIDEDMKLDRARQQVLAYNTYSSPKRFVYWLFDINDISAKRVWVAYSDLRKEIEPNIFTDNVEPTIEQFNKLEQGFKLLLPLLNRSWKKVVKSLRHFFSFLSQPENRGKSEKPSTDRMKPSIEHLEEKHFKVQPQAPTPSKDDGVKTRNEEKKEAVSEVNYFLEDKHQREGYIREAEEHRRHAEEYNRKADELQKELDELRRQKNERTKQRQREKQEKRVKRRQQLEVEKKSTKEAFEWAARKINAMDPSRRESIRVKNTMLEMQNKQDELNILANEADLLFNLPEEESSNDNLAEKKKLDGYDQMAIQQATIALKKLFASEFDISSLYSSVLPALLATHVPFVDFKIEDAWESHFDRCESLWQTIISYGIASGASVQEVANKLMNMYERFPNLARYPLKYRKPLDIELTLKEKMQKNVSIYFKELLMKFMGHPNGIFSSEHIIASLKKNPELLRLVNFKDEYYRVLDYQFVDRSHLPKHVIDEETLFTRAAALGGSRNTNSVFYQSLDRMEGERLALSHQLLDIMERNFDEQTIQYLLMLPRGHEDPLIDVFNIGDDPKLFKRMAYYSHVDLRDRETQKKIIKIAYGNNCPSIMRYLKDELDFDMEDFHAVIESDELHNLFRPMVVFLLDDMGIDLKQGKGRGLFVELLKQQNHSNYVHYSAEIFSLVVLFLEYGADFSLIVNCKELMKVLKETIETLKNWSILKKEHIVALGEMIYLQGLITEKTTGKKAAEKYYQIARTYNNYKTDAFFIRNKIKQIQTTSDVKKRTEFFDQLYARYQFARANYAIPEDILSTIDAFFLITAGQSLPAKFIKTHQSQMDARGEACREFQEYIDSVPAVSLKEQLKHFKKIKKINSLFASHLFDELCRLIILPDVKLEEGLSVADTYYLLSAEKWLLVGIAQDKKVLRETAQEKLLHYLDNMPADAFREQFRQFKAAGNENAAFQFDELCRLITLPDVKLEEFLNLTNALYLLHSVEQSMWAQHDTSHVAKLMRQKTRETLLNYLRTLPVAALIERFMELKKQANEIKPEILIDQFDEMGTLYDLAITGGAKAEDLLSLTEVMHLASVEQFMPIDVANGKTPVRVKMREALLGYMDSKPVNALVEQFNQLKKIEVTGKIKSELFVYRFNEICRLYQVARAHDVAPDETLPLEDTLHLLSIEHFMPMESAVLVEQVQADDIPLSARKQMRKDLLSCTDTVPVDSLRIQLEKLKQLEKTKEQNPQLYIYLFDEICRLYKTIAVLPSVFLSPQEALYLLGVGQFIGKETKVRTKACEKWLIYINSLPIGSLSMSKQFQWLWSVDFAAYEESGSEDKESKKYFLHGERYYLQNLKHACRLYQECKKLDNKEQAYKLICHLIEIAPFSMKNAKPVFVNQVQSCSHLIDRCDGYLELDHLQPEQKQIIEEAQTILLFQYQKEKCIQSLQEACSEYQLGQPEERRQIVQTIFDLLVYPPFVFKPTTSADEAMLSCLQFLQSPTVMPEQRELMQAIQDIMLETQKEQFLDKLRYFSNVLSSVNLGTNNGLYEAQLIIGNLHALLKKTPFEAGTVSLDNGRLEEVLTFCKNHLNLYLLCEQRDVFQNVLAAVFQTKKALYIKKLSDACKLYDAQPASGRAILSELMQASPFEIAYQEILPGNPIRYCHAHLKLPLLEKQKSIFHEVMKILLKEDAKEKDLYIKKLCDVCNSYAAAKGDERSKMVDELCHLIMASPFIKSQSLVFEENFSYEKAVKLCKKNLHFLAPSSARDAFDLAMKIFVQVDLLSNTESTPSDEAPVHPYTVSAKALIHRTSTSGFLDAKSTDQAFLSSVVGRPGKRMC